MFEDTHQEALLAMLEIVVLRGPQELISLPLDGKSVRIARVIDQDARFLQFADRHGLTPGIDLVVESRDEPCIAQADRHRAAER